MPNNIFLIVLSVYLLVAIVVFLFMTFVHERGHIKKGAFSVELDSTFDHLPTWTVALVFALAWPILVLMATFAIRDKDEENKS